MTNDYDYESAFYGLLEQIHAYAPRSCRLLETIKDQRSAYAAYHAAFVIVCLQARRRSLLKKQPMTQADLHEFTFFEIAKGDGQLLALFDELLLSYLQERTAKQPALRRVVGERVQRDMTGLKQKLSEITQRLRQTAQSTRGAAKKAPNLQEQDHMKGMSDGLDLAANEIEAFLDETPPPSDP